MGLLVVEARSAEGLADPGDKDRAYVVVSVTDANGAAVSGLAASAFDVHMAIVGPGGADVTISAVSPKTAGFYVLNVVPIPAGSWRAGKYITTVAVTRGADRGQALAEMFVT